MAVNQAGWAVGRMANMIWCSQAGIFLPCAGTGQRGELLVEANNAGNHLCNMAVRSVKGINSFERERISLHD